MRLIPSNLSLRARFMALTGTVFFIMAVLMVASILYFIVTTEQETWRARQAEAAASAADEVADYLHGNERFLQWVDVFGYDEIQNNPEFLREILLDNPAFLEIIFVDETGNPKYSAARNQPTLANQFTILQSEWFQVANSGQTIYTRVQTSPQNESYTIFAMPSQHGGVLAAQIQMDALWETVAQIRFGESGRIYIVNQRGQVIAHPDTQIVLSNKNIRGTEQFEAVMDSPQYQWAGTSVNFEGVNVVSVSAPVETTDWIVISELPEQEAYAASRRAAFLIPFGILLLSALATFVIREAMQRVFLQPLDLLRDGASEISGGNLSHRITIPRKDELGEVMSVFNSMAADLERQRKDLRDYADSLEKRVEERTSELVGVNAELTAEVAERKRAEDLLRQAEEKYRTLVENIPAAVFIWELSETGACRYISPQIENMLGFPVEDWLMNPDLWRKQLHPEDRARAIADHNHTLVSGQPLHSEYRLLARDGREVWVRDEGVVVNDEEGRPTLNQGYLLDITIQKQAEAQLQASLSEKEVLLKEIHHRVKNNLQVVSSLLNLQASQVKETGALRSLRDSHARVRSMALIHEKLYNSRSLARIDFGEYVRSLSTDLFRSYQRELSGIQLKIEVKEIYLDLDQAIPCGLILNELMTNALKYAFPNGRNGVISVELSVASDQTVCLRVADDGVGIADIASLEKPNSLGWQLIHSLVKQLNGNLRVDGSNGTNVEVSFSARWNSIPVEVKEEARN